MPTSFKNPGRVEFGAKLRHWIEEAKRPGPRTRRIARAVEPFRARKD